MTNTTITTGTNGPVDDDGGNHRDSAGCAIEPSTAATRALTESVDTVKKLLAAGLIDPAVLPPADDSRFKQHPGLGFALAAALTVVVPLVAVAGLGTLALIPPVVLTHLGAAVGGGLVVYAFCRRS